MIIGAVCGYDFFKVSPTTQKTTRRADTRIAGFFALGLWASGYRDYVWRHLFTISVEDYFEIITEEIEALWQGYELVNKATTEPRGRIFVSKTVILLCECRKNRDANHLQNFIYDRKDIDVEKWINDVRHYPIPVPDYTFDAYIRKGKEHGGTKKEFFREKYKALQPRVPGLFDNLA